MVALCDEHPRAAIGVTVTVGVVTRVWAREHCPAWTRETLDPSYGVDWNDTWLSGM